MRKSNNGNLRIEQSINCSGELFSTQSIFVLKEKHYFIEELDLDGDAPKQFIKAYFFQKNSGVKKLSPNTWFPFIAKTAEKWYPHESVIEYMINRIGQTLELRMNEIKLVVANGQIRFLSKFFLTKNQLLIHGAEICGEHLGDITMAASIAKHKSTSRELFTFEFIKEAMRNVFPNDFELITCDLVKMITFDALAGNNDRHFYNWGVIDSIKRTKKRPTFAPLYDSARGLLWNFSDKNIKNYSISHKRNGKKVIDYIQNACPRISIESNTQANHFELIDFIKRYNNDFKSIINDLASQENEERVLEMLKREFYPFFITERSELISLILRSRFEKIRSI